MFYHAIRASSVAMCNTWVWASTVLLSGLPLLFSLPPFSMFWKGSCRFGFLLNMCSGKVLDGLGSQTTCRHVCQTLTSETKSVFLFQFECESFHVSLFVKCQWGTSQNCFNLNFNRSNQIDLWMQQSIYDTVAFWLKMCGNFRAPTLPGTPHIISIF